MEQKTKWVAVALAAWALGGCAHNRSSSQSAAAPGECWGVNACKGQGECGGVGHSCAGKNACKAQGWISLTKSECSERGGQFKKIND